MVAQMQLSLITHQVENAVIPQRTADGYVNATAMCQACGKKVSHYLDQKSTKEFIEALSTDAGIPASALIVIKKGGNDFLEQGTWVHPDVAINLGQWCSPRFAVAVAKWVREWMMGKMVPPKMPYHVSRYISNANKVPPEFFSILNELMFNLIAPLEREGYTLPEHMVPDISEGKMFCNWLRTQKGIEPKEFRTYEHAYEDGRIVLAKLYPVELLPDFRTHFHQVWIPKQMISYFKKRDVKALNFTPKAFPSLYGKPDKRRRIG